MKAIVSVTASWAIGYKNQLIVHNPEDMKHFVRCTKNHTVLMGTRTFESFPKGPLRNRRNIVLAFDASYEHPRYPLSDTPCLYEVYTSFEEAQAHIDDMNDVWVIGGASVYKALLCRCDEVYVTMHDVERDADTYFPNLDEDPHWKLFEASETFITEDGIPYRFCVYKRIDPSCSN